MLSDRIKANALWGSGGAIAAALYALKQYVILDLGGDPTQLWSSSVHIWGALDDMWNAAYLAFAGVALARDRVTPADTAKPGLQVTRPPTLPGDTDPLDYLDFFDSTPPAKPPRVPDIKAPAAPTQPRPQPQNPVELPPEAFAPPLVTAPIAPEPEPVKNRWPAVSLSVTYAHKFGETSRGHGATAHERMQRILDLALSICPIDFGITQCQRTVAEQIDFMKRGASKTFNSRHLQRPALAADLVAWVSGGISYNPVHYAVINEAMQMAAAHMGETLEWSGDWKDENGETFEYLHWQLPRSKYPDVITVAQLLAEAGLDKAPDVVV